MSLQFKERLCASVLFIDKTIIIVAPFRYTFSPTVTSFN